MEFKPMLAATCKHPDRIKFPVLATPKLDGIRCLMVDGKALTRSLKPIPNEYIREEIEADFLDGVDGEIIIPGMRFNDISSVVMRRSISEAATRFEYWIFDYMPRQLYSMSYSKRMENLRELANLPAKAVRVLPTLCDNLQALVAFKEECLQQGYEGICFRDPNSSYKFGRSTERQGWLCKIKPFVDSEARIIGFEEQLHNINLLMEGSTSRRHTFKEGMKQKGTLGKLLVVDISKKYKKFVAFGIGTGFDDELRLKIWTHRDQYLGRIVKYKFQEYGSVNAPRSPVFLGFRDKRDL